MRVCVMLFELLLVVEMLTAVLTIIVVRALDPVLFESYPSKKVEVASVADIVASGVFSVLFESAEMGKFTIAAGAVSHCE